MSQTTIRIGDIEAHLRGQIVTDMRARSERAIFEVLQAYQVALQASFTAGGGQGGVIGAVRSEMLEGVGKIVQRLGVTPQGKYLLNYEFGESGTLGGSGEYKRTKMPPVKAIKKWVLKSGIAIPEKFGATDAKAHQNANGKFVKGGRKAYQADREAAATSFAWAIALHRLHYGRPAMKIIEQVANAQKTRIQQILSGAS